MIYLILLGAHLLICALLLILLKFNILKVHKYMFFVALLMPFWGTLLLLILHFQILHDADGKRDIDVEKLKLESELYKSVTVDKSKVAASTVPIEEALIVNSARERRTIIMDVLNDNPKEYIEFLQKAGNNEDTEVVHYAVTAMVEISKENDYKLQDFERRYSAEPDSLPLLREYTEFLWGCLSQNLMQGQVEVLNRELFSTLIRKKLSLEPTVEEFKRAVENELKRKNFVLAAEELKGMQELYSDREEYYIARLNYLVALGNGQEVKELLEELEKKQIFISASAKEVLAFWKT